MSGAQHTPGPLVVRKSPGNVLPPFFDIERLDQPGCIARVFPTGSKNPEADAQLYAAAPELLEVAIDLLAPLQRAAEALQADGKVLDEFAQASFDRARAAIAKARGQ